MLNPLARYPEVQAASGRQMLPITLISGFLGAGKTTLLNSLLTQGDGRRLAVLVNDFGELNIDAKLIVKVEGQQMELANGCICCSIRDDLVAGVENLLATEPPPEQLLIETSGVSDPINIVCTFNTAKVRRKIFLENVVTVVDAVHALDARDTEYAQLFERQIRGAYMIVLNRTQAAGPEQTQKVRKMITDLLPTASIFETDNGSVPLQVLLGDSRLGQSTFRPEAVMDPASHPFESMVYRSDKPLRRMEFIRTMKSLTDTVYRAKGFLNFKNYPLTTLYQKVGSFESYVDGSAWGVSTPRTELVLIGVSSRFDREALTAALDACVG
ncbi:G3E family GTPase [Panacagrimonas perspica]|uniref:G3E family GTPase n=1 Tax=Panacagrimonas perspica TaxID=381431 RepID=A0A4R7P3H3_9GAMM|nr:GTP-binding protein [Panacagrimonas perspica]TDU28313.1 G3E family GTPase [Panacagrimonas perspica]